MGRFSRFAVLGFALLIGSSACGGSEDSRILAKVRELLAPPVPARSAELDAPNAADSQARSSLPAHARPTPSAVSRIEVPPRVAPRSAADERVVIEGGEFSSLDDAQPVPDEVPYFSYVDESGTARIVRGLHAVPKAHRARAQDLSRSNRRVINRYDEPRVSTRRVASGDAPYNPNRMDVVLYSAEWCGACRKTRAFLDREGVSYDLLDIDADPDAKEEVRRILGQVRIPLLDVDGTYVAGYAPMEILRVLGRRG